MTQKQWENIQKTLQKEFESLWDDYAAMPESPKKEAYGRALYLSENARESWLRQHLK
jgi:hypothetical protein